MVIMGNCLALNCVSCDRFVGIRYYGKKGYQGNLTKTELDGITFSHYSLTSDTSFLDLYPTLKFVENDEISGSAVTSGSFCGDYRNWRHSSMPLIDDDVSLSESEGVYILADRNKTCLDCPGDNTETMLKRNTKSLNKIKIIENNVNDTSDITNFKNNLTMAGGTSNATESISLKENMPSRSIIEDRLKTNAGISNGAMKENVRMNIVAPLSIEEELDDIVMLNPILGKDSNFSYTNLDNEANVKSVLSRVGLRLKFNKKSQIGNSTTTKATCVEKKVTNIFQRKNKIRDQIDGQELGNFCQGH